MSVRLGRGDGEGSRLSRFGTPLSRFLVRRQLVTQPSWKGGGPYGSAGSIPALTALTRRICSAVWTLHGPIGCISSCSWR